MDDPWACHTADALEIGTMVEKCVHKRAIEVPQEVLVAGMETSQPMTAETGGSSIKNYSGMNMK